MKSLQELSKEEMLSINGGVSPLGHALRSISFSALGLCYWIGYAVGSQ